MNYLHEKTGKGVDSSALQCLQIKGCGATEAGRSHQGGLRHSQSTQFVIRSERKATKQLPAYFGIKVSLNK